MSVNDPRSTLLSLQVKARRNPKFTQRVRAKRGRGECNVMKATLQYFFFVFVRPCCIVRLPQIKGLIFDAFAFAVAEVALRQHDQ